MPAAALASAGANWPLLSRAYRLLLIAGAAAVLALLPRDDLVRYWHTPPAVRDPEQLAFAVLGLAACAISLLTVHYPGRPSVSLVTLPVSLAWWELGSPEATLLAGFGTLFANALRRAPALGALAGAGRAVVGTAAGLAAADALAGQTEPSALSLAWLAAVTLFVTVASVADHLLDWLDTRLCDAAEGGLWRWRVAPAPALQARVSSASLAALVSSAAGAASHHDLRSPREREAGPWTAVFLVPAKGTAPLARADLLTNLLLLPLAVFLQIVNVVLGFERLAVVLGGVLVLLLVVRASVNLRTLHDALTALHRTVAEERERLATLFLHSGEGIYTVDGDLRLGSVNPAMAQLLGQAPADLEGQPCSRICHYEDEAGTRLCPDRCPLRLAQARQKPVSQEVVCQAPGQAPKHLLLTYAAVGESRGRLRLGIGIARDVTAQKEADRLREEFVSLVTHELRSPLTTSLGYAQLLERSLRRSSPGQYPDPEKPLYYVSQIEGAERHLLRLVDNLLDLARVERTDLPVEYTTIALDVLVEEAIAAITPLAAAKRLGVRLERADDLPPLWTSELYVREILANLLSNAVKYTPPDGQVIVTLSVSPPGATAPSQRVASAAGNGRLCRSAALGSSHAEIAVTDTGCGMSEEELSRLFSRFFRSSRPEVRQERGTGLGLALTKQMVERLGGTIDVRSQLGAGSTFTVALPLATPPDVADAEPATVFDAN